MPRSRIALFLMLLLCLSFAGCPPSTVPVPNLVGMTHQTANAAIAAAHLTLGQVVNQASSTVAAGNVISQNPAAGASVSSGAAVSLVISTGSVQTPSVAWNYQPASNTIWGQSIDRTADGGYIVAGGDTSYNMYALKLTSAGAKSWEYTYTNETPDSNHSELWRYAARGIRQTSDGEYLMLGAGHNWQDGYPGKSYLFVKLATNGLVQSTNVYSPVNPYSPSQFCSETQPGALELTADGGYVAFGSSYCGQYSLASLYKANSAGTMQFGKVINDNAKAYDQQITDGEQTSDGGYILAGYSDNGFPHGYGGLLIKVGATGNFEWHQGFQDTLGNHGAEAYAVTQTADNGYVLAGNLWNSLTKAINYGPWMAKVTSTGNPVWFLAYGTPNTVQHVRCVKETPDGEILAVGNMGVYMTLSKYNSSGGLLWNYQMTTLPNVIGKEFVLTDDGGCVIVGSGNTGGPTVVVKLNNVYTP